MGSSGEGPLVREITLSAEDDENFHKCVQEAKEVLARGGIVAVPTDTIYGIVSLLDSWPKVLEAKRRPDDKALGLFLEKVEDIPKYATLTVPMGVISTLLPGPVTVVLRRNPSLFPTAFNRGNPNIGIRVAPNRFLRSVCEEMGGEPLVQTSANISGAVSSPLCVEDFKDIWSRLDLIVDGGTILESRGSRLGSTVVDLSEAGQVKIVRDGCAFDRVAKTLHEAGLTLDAGCTS